MFCEALIKCNSQLKVLVSELKKEVETLKAFKPQDDGKWNEVEVRKDDFNHLEKINKRKEQPAKKKQMEPDRKRLRDSDSVKYFWKM